jgi:ATP-dependent Zn protease
MRFALFVILAALIVLAVVWYGLESETDTNERAYSEMLADAAAGDIASIEQEGAEVTVTLTDGSEYITYVETEAVNVYAEACAAAGTEPGPSCTIAYTVTIESSSSQWLGVVISSLLPVALIGAFFYFMVRAQRAKKE